MTPANDTAGVDPAAAARSLRPLIDAEADSIETQGTLSDTIVDALAAADLYKLVVPRAFGGFEADPATIIEVCEELAYADGSVGWAFAQNTTVGAYLAYVAEDVGKRFAGQRAGAGMFAPMGTAHAEEGGYRISGQFQFGSGSGHAQFMGGSALVFHDGELAPMGEDGTPPVVGFLIPAEQVEFRGNWDVMGLRGTGSYDYEVPEQFVEAGATWPIFQRGVCDRVTGGALYGLGAIVVGTIGSAAFCIGVARRALVEIAEIAGAGRARMGQAALAEQQIFQRDLGLHHTAVAAARALIIRAYSEAVEAIDAGRPDDETESLIRATKAAANYTTRVGVEATDFAWAASGSQGMRNPSRIQRCFRDIHMGAGHLVFDDRNYVEVAKETLGLELSAF
jgi:alkylation response protein AidB-like acyl-CoA dehydrogenase